MWDSPGYLQCRRFASPHGFNIMTQLYTYGTDSPSATCRRIRGIVILHNMNTLTFTFPGSWKVVLFTTGGTYLSPGRARFLSHSMYLFAEVAFLSNGSSGLILVLFTLSSVIGFHRFLLFLCSLKFVDFLVL